MDTPKEISQQKGIIQSLNPAFLRQKLIPSEIATLKRELKKMFEHINEEESEENLKNVLKKFLENTYYDGRFYLNTSDRIDLVIRNGASDKNDIGVLLEVKRFANKNEMVSITELNAKASRELLYYFLNERLGEKNLNIRHLIITNGYEWFIFDAKVFERLFITENKQLQKEYNDFIGKGKASTSSEYFYEHIAKPAIEEVKDRLEYTYIDLRDFKKLIESESNDNDEQLIPLYKVFSPEHLLKLPFQNDSNTLDKGFYNELLYILGLEEVKEGGQLLIKRVAQSRRNKGALMELTIHIIKRHDKLLELMELEHPELYGTTEEEQLFKLALELNITWINRILFLKLLEAQLIAYHKPIDKHTVDHSRAYAFLSFDKVKEFDILERLFFDVLAVDYKNREQEVARMYQHIPYLNSSLFETTVTEKKIIFPSSLPDDVKMPLLPTTVLKDSTGKRLSTEMTVLEYLLKFLDAYDFSSEGQVAIQEEQKTLINASVLGLIFEKLNGYEDGAFFTPGRITMYMCREAIRKNVLQKFQQARPEWELSTYKELQNKLANLCHKEEIVKEANALINNITICDPAVGSGHFLVSALNELIALKADLGVLIDEEEKPINCIIELENDEIIVYDRRTHQLLEYNAADKGEVLTIQQTLFNEKKRIIENSLFGVDINMNSVKICRLRLWIELLKHTYYNAEGHLETLPNIDANIKVGNSLIHFIDLKDDIQWLLSKSNLTVEELKELSRTYYETRDKNLKRKIDATFKTIKAELLDPIVKNSKEMQEIEYWETMKTKSEEQQKKFTAARDAFDKKRRFFMNSLEWRMEFPQVLGSDGSFVGFDVVIGNPPYISTKGVNSETSKEFMRIYGFSDDTYNHFFFRGHELLKEGGVLSYITPKTFWTTQTKRNLRDLLLSEQLNYIFDTANPFEAAMVDTCITSFTKLPFVEGHSLQFLDGSEDIEHPQHYEIAQDVYCNTQNSVIFKPTAYNLKIQEKYGRKVKELYDKWWDKISTSKNIAKSAKELEAYRKSLQPGDVALLGCLTEGGQGLATANNGKYIAVRKSSKWAANIIASRPKKLSEVVKRFKVDLGGLTPEQYLTGHTEEEIAIFFDELKEKHGRDIFGQGYIYRLIDDDEIADVDSLTADEKENGIDTSKKYYVPYDKGDKDGNRWYLETPFAIAWNRDNVRFLKTNSGKKGEGMPVVRNPQYYFREGFCWTNVLTTHIKCRLKQKTVHSTESMSLFSVTACVPEFYMVSIMNSKFCAYYIDSFVNSTSHCTTGDAKYIPIIVPTLEQLNTFKTLFERAVAIKKQQFISSSNTEIEKELNAIQEEVDNLVSALYDI